MPHASGIFDGKLKSQLPSQADDFVLWNIVKRPYFVSDEESKENCVISWTTKNTRKERLDNIAHVHAWTTTDTNVPKTKAKQPEGPQSTLTNTAGPTGSAGPMGPMGPTGSMGPRGPMGPTGPMGPY